MAVNAKDVGAHVRIASASVDHEVRSTHPTTLELLEARGVALGRAQSQQIDEQVVDGSDLILVMTADHAKAVVGRFPATRHKVFLLRHLAQEVQPAEVTDSVDGWLTSVHDIARDYSHGEEWDIEDPMGQSDAVYQAVAAQIDEATAWLANVFATLQ